MSAEIKVVNGTVNLDQEEKQESVETVLSQSAEKQIADVLAVSDHGNQSSSESEAEVKSPKKKKTKKFAPCRAKN